MAGHNFKRKLGQNFLKNSRFVNKLLEPLEIKEGDFVIEIGPGDGMVTKALLDKGAKVLAIEYDYDLLSKLLTKLSSYENFHLEHGDILSLRINDLIKKYSDVSSLEIKIVGSLPYNIAKQIIARFLKFNITEAENFKIKKMAFIVQDEVAKMYVAKPPKASLLAMDANIFASIKKLESIPASQFFPKPKVNGGILYFELRDKVNKRNNELQKLLKIGFSTPKKTLLNNLKNSNKYNTNSLTQALEILGLDSNVRPTTISSEQWENLLENIKLQEKE